MDHAPVLRLCGITKRFGPLLANDAISLQLHAGEILALLGENGAGKSTLVSILFGHYRADSGSIEAFGKPLPPGNPKAALAAGIGMVHQHFTLADNLSVLDNMMIGSEPLWQPFSRRRAARAKLLEVAERFGLAVSPDARVGDLSVGERQRVEILKALVRGARILILDEPTAVLTPQESEALFVTLGQMVAGGLSIIFISHKLGEVLRVSNRIAVLRAGRLVAESLAADTSQAQLAEWMVGRAVAVPERRPSSAVGADVCVLDAVETDGAAQDRLRGVSLTLRAGEITAIAGVSGNGQRALAELLSGTRKSTSGSVTLNGSALESSPAWLVAQGVARVPEDRHSEGLVGDLDVWENAVSERLRSPAFSRLGIVRRHAAQTHAAHIMREFDVRGGGLHSIARALSGGNMQKLILGRALVDVAPTLVASRTALPPEGAARLWPGKAGSTPGAGKEYAPTLVASREPTRVPSLIVAHQPTWGLDIGAVASVQQQLIAARDAGAAVLVISDDLDEVLTLGDRVAVMHAGKLSDALPAGAWTREAIGLAMAGSGARAGDALTPALSRREREEEP